MIHKDVILKPDKLLKIFLKTQNRNMHILKNKNNR